MSSFKRRAPSSTSRCPRGCIPSPANASLPIVSTGIPSLDDVLGGGLALGSNLTVLAPDDHSAWSKLVERYYIAQGLASDQDVIILGGADEEQELRDLVKGCMWVDESTMTAQQQYAADGDSDAEGLGPDDGNKTRIAWRYSKMKRFQTSVEGSAGGAGE
jgi:elongator complex protein 4